MKHPGMRWLTAAMLALLVGMGSADAAEAAGKPITIGWTHWADAEFMIALVKQQLEAHTSLRVNPETSTGKARYRTLAPANVLGVGQRVDTSGATLTIGAQYRALAKGDIDAMIMAWLPDTHKHYFDGVRSSVTDLGPMYTGAIVGWAVPDYVPKSEVDSIADLRKAGVAGRFGNTIVGIDPDAGEMIQSRRAMKDYGLGGIYALMDGTDRSMTRALASAIRNRRPIVVTLWTPHWAYAKWNLRFLSDPRHVFGGPQHVDVLVRKGFRVDYPVAAKFFENLHMPLAKLQEAMYVAEQTDAKTAAERFVRDNPQLVASWWKGTGVAMAGACACGEWQLTGRRAGAVDGGRDLGVRFRK